MSPSDRFTTLLGLKLVGESLGCECGLSMMRSDLAYKLVAKTLDRRPYRISGCYGAYHFANNNQKPLYK